MDALLQTLLGGLLALAGAFVGPYHQRKHEEKMAKRADEAIVRSKAEQLFDELDRLMLEGQKSTAAAIKNAQDSQADIVPVPDLGRIRALATVYFPTVSPLISEFEQSVQSLSQKLMKLVMDELKSDVPDTDKVRLMQTALISERNAIAAEFTKKVRRELNAVVPRL